MTTVIFDISVSVDGFMTADGMTPDEPLGQDGQRLHDWAAGGGIERVPSPVSSIGAIVAGRRTYDASLPWWGADGPHPPVPVFVVTNRTAEPPAAGSAYTFVSGIETALEQARAAAGDRDVRIMGGASLGRQSLAAGLVEEMVLHIVPVLLTAGTPMFDGLARTVRGGFEVVDVVSTPSATHVHYRLGGVENGAPRPTSR